MNALKEFFSLRTTDNVELRLHLFQDEHRKYVDNLKSTKKQ